MVCNCILGVAPVQGIAGELGIVAKILLALFAVAALAISVSKLWNPNSLANAKSLCQFSLFHHCAYDLVTGN